MVTGHSLRRWLEDTLGPNAQSIRAYYTSFLTSYQSSLKRSTYHTETSETKFWFLRGP